VAKSSLGIVGWRIASSLPGGHARRGTAVGQSGGRKAARARGGAPFPARTAAGRFQAVDAVLDRCLGTNNPGKARRLSPGSDGTAAPFGAAYLAKGSRCAA
jgi:hypothetical protein